MLLSNKYKLKMFIVIDIIIVYVHDRMSTIVDMHLTKN